MPVSHFCFLFKPNHGFFTLFSIFRQFFLKNETTTTTNILRVQIYTQLRMTKEVFLLFVLISTKRTNTYSEIGPQVKSKKVCASEFNWNCQNLLCRWKLWKFKRIWILIIIRKIIWIFLLNFFSFLIDECKNMSQSFFHWNYYLAKWYRQNETVDFLNTFKVYENNSLICMLFVLLF